MEREEKRIERFLSVGTSAFLHLGINWQRGPRLTTVFRGWHRPHHILMDRPQNIAGQPALLQEGQDCTVRFVHEGSACAIVSQVIDCDRRKKNPYLRICWPGKVEFVSFRTHERIRLQLDAVVLRADGVETATDQILDLSLGGCRILSPKGADSESKVTISTALPDGTILEGIEAAVREVQETGKGWALGCQFEPNQQHVEIDVAFFVTSTLLRQRISDPDAVNGARVLILDDREELRCALRKELEGVGFEVILATNVVDGIYRMHMAPPEAVFVCQSLAQMPGLELCRLVSSIEDFDTPPIYLYGGDGQDLQQAAAEAGVASYFPPSENMVKTMVEFLANMLGKSLEPEPPVEAPDGNAPAPH